MGLDENGAFFRVDTAGQVQGQRIQRGFTQRSRVLTYSDSMLIHDAIDAMVLILHVDPLTERTHVVADSQFT